MPELRDVFVQPPIQRDPDRCIQPEVAVVKRVLQSESGRLVGYEEEGGCPNGSGWYKDIAEREEITNTHFDC